jgi:uncharacterized protein
MRCAHGKGLLACSQCQASLCKELETFYSKGYEKARQNAMRRARERWMETLKVPSSASSIVGCFQDAPDELILFFLPGGCGFH